MSGPAIVAVGLMTRLTPVMAAGAALVVTAALALAWHAASVVVRRGRWTTDHAWHRFVQGSLLASVGWFAIGTVLAAAVVVEAGATARAWDTAVVAGPLALGWAAQALVGSWSHLVPAVGPGSPPVHARQRAVLGRWGTARVGLTQVGVALVSVGAPMGDDRLAQAGLALVAAGVAVAVVLLAAALRPLVSRPSRVLALDRSGTISR
jgi:nitrite reductase (NO-forming)